MCTLGSASIADWMWSITRCLGLDKWNCALVKELKTIMSYLETKIQPWHFCSKQIQDGQVHFLLLLESQITALHLSSIFFTSIMKWNFIVKLFHNQDGYLSHFLIILPEHRQIIFGFAFENVYVFSVSYA
jgi:hypothetical protein